MPIDKTKNVSLQITFPKEDAQNLEAFRKALENNGNKKTKSEILRDSFNFMLKALSNVAYAKNAKSKGGKNNA